MNDFEEIKCAVMNSVKSMMGATTKEEMTQFISIVKLVRESIILPLTTPTVLTSNVWGPIRNNQALLNDILTGTVLFQGHFTDIDELTERVVEYYNVFDTRSQIIDNEVRNKCMSSTDLYNLMSNNRWLLFIVVSGWYLSDILDTIVKGMVAHA